MVVNRLRLIGEIEKISSRYPHAHPYLPIDYQNYKSVALIQSFTTGQRNLLMRPAPLSHKGVLKMKMHTFSTAKKRLFYKYAPSLPPKRKNLFYKEQPFLAGFFFRGG